MSVGGVAPLGILVLLPVDVVDLGQGVVIIILLPEDITQGFHMFCLNSITHLCVDSNHFCADHLNIRRRSISPREERYDRGRSYSRSPAYNGSKGRSVTPARGKSRSISPSPRRSISRSPRRSISRSRSPRGNRSPGPGRSISRSPRGNRSPSPRRSRSYTPEQARSRSPPRGEQYEDRSPSP